LIVKNITRCRYGVFKVHADRARPTQEGRRSAGLSKLNSERPTASSYNSR
jgi:hypothetical protein